MNMYVYLFTFVLAKAEMNVLKESIIETNGVASSLLPAITALRYERECRNFKSSRKKSVIRVAENALLEMKKCLSLQICFP